MPATGSVAGSGAIAGIKGSLASGELKANERSQEKSASPGSATLKAAVNHSPQTTMPTVQNETKSAEPKIEKEAVLHILQRGGGVIEREITQAETMIGKGPQNDIILTDPSVSGTHAKINYISGEFFLTDLGSRNGTLLNEMRVTDQRPIEHGDLIKMGHCTITFRLKAAETTLSMPQTVLLNPNAPPPPPSAPPPPKTPPMTEDALAAALVSSGLIAQTEIDRVWKRESKGNSLVRTLLEEKLATEIGLRDLMSRTFNLAPVELKSMTVDTSAANALRAKFLQEHLICPVVGQQPDRLMLVVADPTNKFSIDEAERITRKKASLRLALSSEIKAQLESFFTPRLIGVMPTGEKIETLLNHQETEIGKATHNRLVINDATVSSTHAVIIARDGGYNIADLGSSNGTFINGQKLGSDAQILQHGDKIQLGQVLLTFRNPAETTENKTAKLSLEALEEIRRRAMTRNLQTPPPGFKTDPNMWQPPALAVPTPEQQAAYNAQQAALNAQLTAEQAEKAEKKKKKEKEKGSWTNFNSLSRIIAQIMGALVSLVGTILIVKFGFAPDKGAGNGSVKPVDNGSAIKLVSNGGWTSFGTGWFGGALEASGAQYVIGWNGVLVVSDNRKSAVLGMQLDEKGAQVGDLKEIPLGVTFKDPESITYGNGYFYITTSQANPADGPANAIIRFDFNPETQTLRSPAEIIPDLRAFLLQNVTEISSLGAPAGPQGGLNIEGCAWDPNNERLLLGLRSPQIGSQAVIVPIKLRDPRAPFKLENLKVDDPRVIVFPLDGQGIRDITYDTQLKNFLIISGAPETSPKTDFGLWEWNGQPGSNPTKLLILDDKMKPEGVTSVRIGGKPFVFIAGDAGSYLKLDYSGSK
jgi:pSer/pThr/pTyr-binding forkhead associated (FHA) protein